MVLIRFKRAFIVVWCFCGCLLDSDGLIFTLAFCGVILSTLMLAALRLKEEAEMEKPIKYHVKDARKKYCSFAGSRSESVNVPDLLKKTVTRTRKKYKCCTSDSASLGGSK